MVAYFLLLSALVVAALAVPLFWPSSRDVSLTAGGVNNGCVLVLLPDGEFYSCRGVSAEEIE